MANTDHASISPSSMKRLIECPASLYFSETLPPLPTSSYAVEGTKAHAVAEKALADKIDTFGSNSAWLRNAPTLSVSTQGNEMQYYAEEYAEYVSNELSVFLQNTDIYDVATFIEKRVHYTEQCWGTADCIALVCDKTNGKTFLYVFDYKYGSGIAVSAKDNYQMLTYALAISETLKAKDILIDNYSLHIFQPRASVDQSYNNKAEYTNNQITPLFDRIRTTVELLSNTPIDKLNTLPCNKGDHCRWCSGNGVCSVLNGEIINKTLALFKAVQNASDNPKKPDVSVIPQDDLVYLALHKNFIEKLLIAVEDGLKNALLNGAQINGVKLVEAKKQRAFVDDTEFVAEQLKKLGIEQPVSYKPSLITLTEAEKILGKGRINHLLKNRADEMPSYKVVPTDAKGDDVQPVSLSAVNLFRDIF